jgi:octaprenyl-diphosphate synthase
VDKNSKRMIINTIKRDKQDPVKVNKIISIVIENGGIQYAENKMHEYKNLALRELDQLPNSPAKESFIGLIHYSINRKK